MDSIAERLQQIDMQALSGVCARLVSVETVRDIQDFVAKVDEMQRLVVAAALRIAGYDEAPEPETDARALPSPSAQQRIDALAPRAEAAYRAWMLE